MFPYLIAAAIGAIAVNRKRPAVAHKKKTALGPRTGITYEVDDFSSAGMILVKAPDGTVASFTRNPPPGQGFRFVSATGNPKVIALVRTDFECEFGDSR